MRYNLGYMDQYPIEVCGTNIENDPLFKIVLKTPVDPTRLEDAVYRAIKFHPLFGTQVRYDGVYYLQTNNRPIRLIHADETTRPLEFCESTNGYPWQLCWSGHTILFEWCHGVTDGRGALSFIKTLLSIYFGVEYKNVPRSLQLGPGLEPFVDKAEKGIDFETQPKGFPLKALPIFHKRGYETDCHVIKASTKEILKVSKQNESSPSVMLAVLMSQVLRDHLPKNISNQNVACNIVMDLRVPLHYETMHNCVEYKRVTYQDRHTTMSTHEVSREFKAALDNARLKENVVRAITDRVNLFKTYHKVKTKSGLKMAVTLIGKVLKHSDCNMQITYLGTCDFPQIVLDNVAGLQFRVWHDFGEMCLAAVDFNGTFTINICENYIDKSILDDFIQRCAEEGIHWTLTEDLSFVQGHFVEEKIAL